MRYKVTYQTNLSGDGVKIFLVESKANAFADMLIKTGAHHVSIVRRVIRSLS